MRGGCGVTSAACARNSRPSRISRGIYSPRSVLVTGSLSTLKSNPMRHEKLDPEEILSAPSRRESREGRGRLKVFFGASAGVGKTYTMLESARAALAAGVDVVAGYIEPHGRVDIERLRAGLEQLPYLEVVYRNITRREFDLDAALKRRPQVILVDELAHSNCAQGEPKPRHSKRWQDVDELLAAGIDVWTTLNVQHLESLNDVVERVTGVRQR